MKTKTPCGKIIEHPKHIPPHLVIENECIDNCEYGGIPPLCTCGYFHDWFLKNHKEFDPTSLRGKTNE